MKVDDFLMGLADIYADAKLYESGRNEMFLSNVIGKLEHLLSVADFESTLNVFKRLVYRQMVAAKENGQHEENKRLYSVYQKMKYVQELEEALELMNGR